MKIVDRLDEILRKMDINNKGVKTTEEPANSLTNQTPNQPTNQDIMNEITKLHRANKFAALIFFASVAIAGILVGVGTRMYGWGVFAGGMVAFILYLNKHYRK